MDKEKTTQDPNLGLDDDQKQRDRTPDSEKQSEEDVEQVAPEKPQGPPPGAFDPTQNPDGGAKAWLCVLGGFCTLFCSFGLISMLCLASRVPFLRLLIFSNINADCVGVFQAYYENVTLRQYAPDTIAWISSLMIFFMFFFGPIIGM